MALRSVILAPPPAPRKVVVLRPGPAPGQGKLRDLIVGVVGALLLVATVILAFALPPTDHLPPQYKVSFLDGEDPHTSMTFNFTATEAGRHHDFEYESSSDNVYQINVAISFKDDVPASDPDLFLVQLLDPDGNQVGTDLSLANDAGVQSPGFALQYDAVQFGRTYVFSPVLKPADAIVQTPLNTTATELEAQLEAKNHFPSVGTWTIRVTLVQAGGCPAPQPSASPGAVPSPEQSARITTCQQETQSSGGKDLGNALTVGSFTFRRFEPVAEKLA